MAITFESIGNGELAGMFRTALAQVGQNILDPNMDPEAVRGMTINIKFKPQKSGAIDAAYDIKTKLAGLQTSGTTFMIGQDARTGRIEMSEYGNNRPQVAAYVAAPQDAAPRQPPEPETQEREFDPETGEIYKQPNKPIDLRKAAGE